MAYLPRSIQEPPHKVGGTSCLAIRNNPWFFTRIRACGMGFGYHLCFQQNQECHGGTSWLREEDLLETGMWIEHEIHLETKCPGSQWALWNKFTGVALWLLEGTRQQPKFLAIDDTGVYRVQQQWNGNISKHLKPMKETQSDQSFAKAPVVRSFQLNFYRNALVRLLHVFIQPQPGLSHGVS